MFIMIFLTPSGLHCADEISSNDFIGFDFVFQPSFQAVKLLYMQRKNSLRIVVLFWFKTGNMILIRTSERG